MIYDLDNSDRALIAAAALEAVEEAHAANSFIMILGDESWGNFIDPSMRNDAARSIMESVRQSEYVYMNQKESAIV